MTRKVTSIIVVVTLPVLFLTLTGPGAGAAQEFARPPGHGGMPDMERHHQILPHLKTGGVSPTEVFTITATLGTTTSPCVTSFGNPQLGKIKGKLKFMSTGGANKCSTVFSGSAITPTPRANSS